MCSTTSTALREKKKPLSPPVAGGCGCILVERRSSLITVVSIADSTLYLLPSAPFFLSRPPRVARPHSRAATGTLGLGAPAPYSIRLRPRRSSRPSPATSTQPPTRYPFTRPCCAKLGTRTSKLFGNFCSDLI